MSEKEFEPTSLADALGDSDEAEAAVAAPVEAEQPVVETQASENEGQTALETLSDAPQEPEAKETGEQPAEDADKPWTYHMAMDEKSKRKALEKELAEIKAQQAAIAYQQKQNAPKVEAPDVFDDQAAYTNHLQQQTLGQVTPVISALQRQLAELRHTPEAVTAANDWFKTLAPHEAQSLEGKCFAGDDPYGALVTEYKKAQMVQEIGEDPDAYKQRIIAEHMAAQGGQPAQTGKPSQTQIMPSATKMPSVSARSGPAWAGPTPLSEILPD